MEIELVCPVDVVAFKWHYMYFFRNLPRNYVSVSMFVKIAHILAASLEATHIFDKQIYNKNSQSCGSKERQCKINPKLIKSLKGGVLYDHFFKTRPSGE